MSQPEQFLSRWSRRKRQAEDETRAGARNPPARPSDRTEPDPHREPADRTAPEARVPGERNDTTTASRAAPEAEPFLETTLPSIESINAETDIRAFLQTGVPADLTRAALRRAWTADPTIRDFIEIAENQWDFATGADLPGFGSLDASAEDVRRMVANVFGELSPADAESTPLPEPEAPETGTTALAADVPQPETDEMAALVEGQPLARQDGAVGTSDVMIPSGQAHVAMQQKREDEAKPLPTRHGTALPR